MAFSPDGSRVVTAAADHLTRVWSVPELSLLAELEGHQGFVYTADFSPDGERLATAAWDGTVREWRTDTWASTRTLEVPGVDLSAVAYTPDGRSLITSSYEVIRWDDGQDAQHYQGHSAWVADASLSPDGRLLATASDDFTARVWEVESGKELLSLRQEAAVYFVSFSPDGQTLAVGVGEEVHLYPLRLDLAHQQPTDLLQRARQRA